MLKTTVIRAFLAVMFFSFAQWAVAHTAGHQHQHKAPLKPEVKQLLSSELSNIPGIEVKISEVKIPPNSELPKHWHPGDEFGYVIEGSVIHWQKDGKPRLVKAGDAVKIPLGQIHTAITRQEGASILVFRIHPKGQPERITVE